jgi:hypothetical protein
VRQPHRNLFYSYRGPNPRIGERNFVFERQLEDNATKALINVLEHSDRSTVLRPFLRDVVDLDHKSDPDGIQFALQRVDIGRPEVKKKIALAIAPISGLEQHRRSAAGLSGRPDAWIWDEQDFAILVETKVVGQANSDQMRRHIATAIGWENGRAKTRSVSWERVYEFFKAVNRHPRALEPTTRFLVGEYLDYLNMISVTNRIVFDVEDFVFFALPEKERSSTHKAVVVRKLEQFTKQLADTDVVRKIVKLYGKNAATSRERVSRGVFRDLSAFLCARHIMLTQRSRYAEVQQERCSEA